MHQFKETAGILQFIFGLRKQRRQRLFDRENALTQAIDAVFVDPLNMAHVSRKCVAKMRSDTVKDGPIMKKMKKGTRIAGSLRSLSGQNR
jgi:hypothetical protein